MATVSGNSGSGLYGIGLNGSLPVGNNYGNSNVASFLTTYNGNLSAGQIVVQVGNIAGNGIVAGQYYWANGVPLTNTLYSNLSASQFLPTYTGNTAATITTATQLDIRAIGPQVNLTAASNVNIANNWINNLNDPIQLQDSATKNYVDSIAAGLNVHAAVSLATTAPLPTYTYNNGNAGVGATINGTLNGLLAIDGLTVLVGSRVLIKNETGLNSPYNGVYTCTRNNNGSTYQLTRATDMNNPIDFYGAIVYVVNGNDNSGSTWINTNDTAFPISIGYTPITFIDAGGGGGGIYLGGQGISISPPFINLNVDGNTTYINGLDQVAVNPNLTLTNLTLTGNLYANTSGHPFVIWEQPGGAPQFLIDSSNNNIGFGERAGSASANGAISFNNIAIGYFAGQNGAGYQSIAIGTQAGLSGVGINSVSIGTNAGKSAAGNSSVNLGFNTTTAAPGGIAIGQNAVLGQATTVNSIAIGVTAGSPNGLIASGGNAISIGYQAGATAESSIAIGQGSRASGNNSIHIGTYPGTYGASQANTIVLNATATNINPASPGLYVAPIANNFGVGNSVFPGTCLIYYTAAGGDKQITVGAPQLPIFADLSAIPNLSNGVMVYDAANNVPVCKCNGTWRPMVQ